MSTRRMIVALGVALLPACGGATTTQSAEDAAALQLALSGVNDTRCEYQGRKDRVAVLTVGRGARAANVRRVYAVGDERDGRRVLRCREVDTNLDGKKDVVRTYNERGEPLSEQSDSDYDGQLDTWVEFAGGALSRAEFDRNRDGKADEFKTYSAGHLARVQRDRTFDGQIDTWEVYEQGQLRRIGTDTDGDERVDKWYRNETKKAEPAQPPAASGEPQAEAEEATDSTAEDGAEATEPAQTTTTPQTDSATKPNKAPATKP
jgi:hypothetical protein